MEETIGYGDKIDDNKVSCHPFLGFFSSIKCITWSPPGCIGRALPAPSQVENRLRHYTNLALTTISATPANALETGQFSLAFVTYS